MFHQRLTAVLAEKKIYPAEFARLIGKSPQTVNGWLKGTREPDLETIELIVQKLEISILDLVTEGKKTAGKDIGGDEAPGTTENGYITLPRLNICPSAGAGTITEEEMPVDFVRFKEEWLRSTLQVNPAYLKVLPVDGDSMEPTLRSGDIIVVDCRKPDHIKDGVYVIRHDGALKVKRLQGLGRGAIKITSDNPHYDSITIGPEEPPDEFAVCGRVVWAGRRM